MHKRSRFGFTSASDVRRADLFFADLMGTARSRPRRRRRESFETASGPWAAPPDWTAEYEDLDTSTEDEPGPAEAVVGQARIGSQTFMVDPASPATLTGATYHAALQHALGRSTHSLVLGDPLSTASGFAAHSWGPPNSFNGPKTIGFDANGVAALLLADGRRAYFQANPLATSATDRTHWVHVPFVAEFLRLPAAQQTSQRNSWGDKLSGAALVNPTTSRAFTRAERRALPVPTQRLLLAHNAATAYPVAIKRRRGTDRGGVTHGSTLSLIRRPIQEPLIYLRVISMREGRMESINAWDLEAGISVGPIQFNAQRGSVFRFLWQVWSQDRALFQSTFGTPLDWSMRNTAGYPELRVTVGGAPVWLRGRSRAADVTRNYAYFQSGDPTRSAASDIDPAFRRDLAGRFVRLVAWPHIQELVEDVSNWWLRPGLARIHAAGIPALVPASPDRDTFILKSLLMSTYVRYSGCLQPFLEALGRWTTVADKLANWQTAVSSMTGPCNASGTARQQGRNANLVTRLNHQHGDATTVFTEITAVLAP